MSRDHVPTQKTLREERLYQAAADRAAASAAGRLSSDDAKRLREAASKNFWWERFRSTHPGYMESVEGMMLRILAERDPEIAALIEEERQADAAAQARS